MDAATIYYYCSVVFSINIIIICFLLILFASRIPTKSNDVKLIILIGTIELLIPILTSTDPIYTLVNGEKVIYNLTACTVTGFFYEIVAFYEIIFNAFLAIERVLIFRKSKILKLVYWVLAINSIIFLILLITCSALRMFMHGSTRHICLLDAANYALAAFTHLFRDFNCLSGVLVCLYCYYEISKEVNGFRKVQNNGFELSTKQKERSKEYQLAIIKTYISLTVYGIFMLTANLVFPTEVVLKILDKPRFTPVIDPLHYIGLTCTCVGFIANTALILFFHTGIRHEAEKFYEQIKGFYQKVNKGWHE
ncbi:hypothetical protein K502DRAFT_351254 [Neoconidiobolus thromboides FSU 785]|nr:hypothetical protein K502DRAFT_351254 [Neoconidiobolus thromboides FSU 785]